MVNSPHQTVPRRSRWPWVLLALALTWVVVARIPLVLNAAVHLDSDLAVDGITLDDATHGHWRWHYPGTPYIGIVPVLYSLPQALILGASPATLVSGGVVSYLLVVLLTFLLGQRVFGTEVACWGLLPLAFASTGTLWLSGRVTGGHLSAAAWHAGAFLLLHRTLSSGTPRSAALLGFWCGLGMFVDSMFVLTFAGLLPAAFVGWWSEGRSRRALLAVAWFAAGFGVGLSPREIGRRVDPYDAYKDQFALILDHGSFEPETHLLARQHAQLYLFDCLPRLIAGHRIPGLQADPDPAALSGPAPARSAPETGALAWLATVVPLSLFAVSLAALTVPSPRAATRAVQCGILVSTAAAAAGFILSRNVFDPDNYRYLVDLLIPWSLGFGRTMQFLARRGSGGKAMAALVALSFAGIMTADSARWYARFGWIDATGVPVQAATNDPLLAWLNANREFDGFEGDYWDVYRAAFLTHGRVTGTPFPEYPDRFADHAEGASRHAHRLVIGRKNGVGALHLQTALAQGGHVRFQGRGFTIVALP